MLKLKSLFLALVSVVPVCAYAQTGISICDFGGEPNSHTDVMPAVKKALQYCEGRSDIVINFPRGRYDFYPESDNIDVADIGFRLSGLKDLTIDGGGSEFIFHGRMGIAVIDSCSNVTMRDFSIDWDRPWISQAEIVASTDDHLDIRIDAENYPYEIKDGRIYFLGEGWRLPVLDMYNNLYDPQTREIVYNTWDSPLGGIFSCPAESLGDGIVRFHGSTPMHPEPGTIVSLFHVRYYTTGFSIQSSKDVVLKDINIYHCLSNAVYGELTDNITMDHTSVMVNDAKGRVFSGVADASHFSNCKGVIKVENCAHTGQGDDFINVHGRDVRIMAIPSERTIEVKSDGRLNRAGDEMWFIQHSTAQRGEVRTIESISPIEGGGYSITFTQSLPSEIAVGDFVENKTWTAGLELRHCQILKRHRARGILVSTPKDVIIEDNYFRSAGTAILIEGDMDYWFESGACTNVQIRNNVFEDCLTSGNAQGNRGQWGEAVITITPSHMPSSVEDEPYHRNINIHDNVFKVFDAPLVHARSVRALSFTHNDIIKTDSYEPYTWQRDAFLLDGCRQVKIKGNRIDPAYLTRTISTEHMRPSDIKAPGFTVSPLDQSINTHLVW